MVCESLAKWIPTPSRRDCCDSTTVPTCCRLGASPSVLWFQPRQVFCRVFAAPVVTRRRGHFLGDGRWRRDMSTRDRIEAAVKSLLTEISTVTEDEDATEMARVDCRKLYNAIDKALHQFNRFDGWGDNGPTREDLKGEVRHDIG